MKLRAKNVLPVVLAVCVLMSMGMKKETDKPISLRIVQHPGYPFPGEPLKTKETVVEIDGKTKEAQQFLAALWEHNRPLFKKSEEVRIPVDSSWTEIFFNYGKEALTVGGHYYEQPQEEFGKGIKNILEESLKFQKEQAKLSSSTGERK